MKKNKYLFIIATLVILQIVFFWILFNRLGFSYNGYSQEAEVLLEQDIATIPKSYGHLVTVSVSDSVHHMFFEADDGTIRIVYLTRPQKRSKGLHSLLIPDNKTYTLKRE